MFSRFFIERPIFANVIAIVTMIAGLIALYLLPVEQFPPVTPPTVQISTVYPGANAQIVADTVAAPLEQEVNGVEGMLYMSSTSASDGSYRLTVTFEIGTNLDTAQVLVQNRIAAAEPRLPEEVKRQGITARKRSTNILMFLTLTSTGGRHDRLFLSNYATLRLKDELSRVPGVGDISVFGSSEYAMRIWLDPDKLKARNLTTQDVITAIQEQNVQVAAGQIGEPPAPAGTNFQYTVTTLGRLTDVTQFEKIILKTGEEGRVTYLKDVARLERGSQVYGSYSEQTGQPSAGLGIFQLPGANALRVGEEVRQRMAELSRSFPEGVKYAIALDTTQFIQAAVNEVYLTLFEAGVLVLLVILIFLQDWRAVLVPATTVPVTIIGAFAFMAALGFSINMLTLFGLVLAIGIVVDDAIVIVENAVHHIDQDKLDRKNATIKAMAELLGPIISITLVLMAVFLPASFMGGITGQLYRQFALTIAATALISAINALTLKPAQCAMYLRPSPPRRNFFFRGFNYVYGGVERAYAWLVGRIVRWSFPMMLVFFALLGLTAWWLWAMPTGFLPTEDQGYVIIGAQLPDAASLERTHEVTDKISAILAETPGVGAWTTNGGNSVLDGSAASNAATFYVRFENWRERIAPSLRQEAIVAELRRRFGEIQDAQIFVLVPPSIRGLGVAGGFQMQVQDRGGVGLDELQKATQELVRAANAQPGLASLNSTFRAGVPQLFADVNRVQAKSLDVPLSTIFNTLQSYLGSAYVNDFNQFNRTYQVRIQADAPFRTAPDDIRRLEVRNRKGDMVPLGALVDVAEAFGPPIINRYNLYPSASITGEAAKGTSSGQALALMEELAQRMLPSSMGFEWTGVSYQERQVGGQAFLIFALAVLLVYLVLAAQYESWTSPAAVILVVPLGVLGSVAAVALRGMENNVYTQIGLVLIIALASKNAILIVEFARELRAQGRTILDAAVQASRLRFRPILMTSFAFILGMVPLVIAQGAGAASRQALGTAVFGGMITATFLAVFFVPVFFVVLQTSSEWWRPPKRPLQL